MVRGLGSEGFPVDRMASRRMTATGDPLASQLGSSGGWPPYFERLPGH